jgi:hypothetical protein
MREPLSTASSILKDWGTAQLRATGCPTSAVAHTVTVTNPPPMRPMPQAFPTAAALCCLVVTLPDGPPRLLRIRLKVTESPRSALAVCRHSHFPSRHRDRQECISFHAHLRCTRSTAAVAGPAALVWVVLVF